MERRPIAKLHRAGQLRPSYLLRALREQRLSLFMTALAALGGYSMDDVRIAINADRPDILALACLAWVSSGSTFCKPGPVHFSIKGDELHNAFADLAMNLQDLQDKGKAQLCIANSLWSHKEYPISKDYIDLLRRDYDATVTPVDFINETKGAGVQINKWVEEKTRGKITEMVPSTYFDHSTRLVLVDAIYFKGMWAHQFKKESTTNGQFRMINGASVAAVVVPMMTQESEFGYAEYDNMQLLEMPYAGNELSMLVLLPKKPDGIAELEKSLTPENLAKWTGKHDAAEVSVTMPKFKTTCEFQLNDKLSALGMTDAFDPAKADFSGMDGQKHSLFISAVLHKAFVEVNEEGTEAAAATGVVVVTNSISILAAPVPFRADHPFLFLIRDNFSGSVLFIGKMMDPSK